MKKPIVIMGLLIALSAGALLHTVYSRAGALAVDPAAALPAVPAAEPATPFIHAAEIASLARYRTPALRSSVALVMDAREGVTLYAHDIDGRRPIASLTKLMTAMVVLDAKLPLDEPITITKDDRDRLRGTRSRLAFGSEFTRHDLLKAALAASENRAAAALARTYPGGTPAMIAAMNAKAAELGMTQTYYRDSSGLDSHNVSTARDLARLVVAARQYPLITEFTTTEDFRIADVRTGKPLEFINTNRLVRNGKWEIGLSKTGYTRDAGNCLVMEVRIADRPVILVLLDSWGKLTKYGDSTRIRDWLLAIDRRLRAQDSAVASTRS